MSRHSWKDSCPYILTVAWGISEEAAARGPLPTFKRLMGVFAGLEQTRPASFCSLRWWGLFGWARRGLGERGLEQQWTCFDLSRSTPNPTPNASRFYFLERTIGRHQSKPLKIHSGGNLTGGAHDRSILGASQHIPPSLDHDGRGTGGGCMGMCWAYVMYGDSDEAWN